MELTGLELTLRRISQIESNISNLCGQLKEATSDFDTVLQQTMNTEATSGIPDVPEGFTMETFNNSGNAPKTEVDGLIKKYANQYNIDENLVKAVIKAESGFNSNAKSPVGAQGLMQLMPATAKSLGVDNPFDPEQNIAGGVKYLKGLIDRFDGKLDLAVAAYNAGPGAVNKYGGIPPYNETQNYVKKVLGYQKEFTGF